MDCTDALAGRLYDGTIATGDAACHCPPLPGGEEGGERYEWEIWQACNLNIHFSC